MACNTDDGPRFAPSSDRIWGEPLTENERAMIARVFDGSTGFVEARKWLAHVVKVHDALAARIRDLEAGS